MLKFTNSLRNGNYAKNEVSLSLLNWQKLEKQQHLLLGLM